MRNIGDLIWIVRTERRPVVSTCPDCLGTAKWHCVLPNGEEFDVECARCYHGGYDPSTGVVYEDYEHHVHVLETAITKVEVYKDHIEYGTETGYCGFNDGEVYGTKAEAEAGGERLLQEIADRDDAAMKDTARKKGRPRKKKDGSCEANPSEFGGGSSAYARRVVRDSLKEAIRWVEFARRHGTEIDLQKMLDAVLQPNSKS